MRPDGRKSNQMRKVTIRKNYLQNAFGSCLIEMGNTKVLCTASVDDKVPPFLNGKGQGWLTAEYGMLPASCSGRIPREASKGKQSGRTQEIQRLIGRSLRSTLDMKKLGERTIWIDCDVIQGDGGTRTASITGGFIAMAEAIKKLMKAGDIKRSPIIDYVAAISVGIVDGKPALDLCYVEDSKADVDMNIIMTGKGKFVEVQGTAEAEPFSNAEMTKMLALAKKGISDLVKIQKKYTK